MKLFRPEAVAAQSERLHGDVNLALPISWHAIGGVLTIAVLAALTFLFAASYSRIENVTGSIVPDRGVAAITPLKTGVITDILVGDGEVVRPGQPLARLRYDDALQSGGPAAARLFASLDDQDASLETQLRGAAAAAGSDTARLQASLNGIEREAAALEDQLAVQAQLVAGVEADLAIARRIAANGFLKRNDLRALEDSWLSRRQQLSQLSASYARKIAEAEATRQSIDQARAQADAQRASLEAARAEVHQRRITTEANSAMVVTAPVGGRITALSGRRGQMAGPQGSIMSIVPVPFALRAELYVPTTAVGFLAVGQEVRVSVDAFPYERFGTVPATIERLSTSAVGRPAADGTVIPMYLATARLARHDVPAFGQRQPLLPGMTLRARIITEKQSLIRWLFSPLFALRNR